MGNTSILRKRLEGSASKFQFLTNMEAARATSLQGANSVLDWSVIKFQFLTNMEAARAMRIAGVQFS